MRADSACASTRTRSTSRQARATGRRACGTCSAGRACGCSSGTRGSSPRSPSARTGSTSPPPVRLLPPRASALSPLTSTRACAGEDLAINLWDLGSGKRIKKMTGHTASVYSLAFSEESAMLARGWSRVESLGQEGRWLEGVTTEDEWADLMKKLADWQQRWEDENGEGTRYEESWDYVY